MTQTPPRVAMVAGETSGDLLAGLLLDGLKNAWPDLSAHGIGGAQMAQRGFDAWWPSEKLAVHGYSFEVLRRLREIIGIRKQLRARLLADKPDVFIGVDAPDFNLGLEADLRAAGVKTVHFVCPSIWAWRADRIEKIRRSADHVLCIFPFEPELLARHGIAATYVGHPLAACDVTLIASGTATLEAALFKRPMVIGYRMHALSWRLMRRKQLQPWVGLPNILCGEFVVPELIQDAATPPALAAAVLQWFDARHSDPQRITALEQRFTALHHSLLRNTPQLAADAIRQVVND